jgi:hypothetical protein
MTEPGDRPTLTTTISRKWTIKMVVISVVCLGVGVWGYWDATVAYPARGALASAYLEYQYLDQFQRGRPPLDSRAGVPDPAAELRRLEAVRAEKGELHPADAALVRWMESLSLIGRLDGPTATAIPRTDFRGDDLATVTDARSRYEALRRLFTTATGEPAAAPSELSRWDIPVQWLIMVVCGGIGLYLDLLIVRVHLRRYRFDPATLTLTLPGGQTITPADIEDIDKRKWHKLYCSVVVKKDHPTLGGKSLEMDLLRYEPLEAWVLEMERAAFPDRAAREAAAAETVVTTPAPEANPPA